MTESSDDLTDMWTWLRPARWASEACVVCLDRPPGPRLPCGHTVLCAACLGQLRGRAPALCPVCRAPLKPSNPPRSLDAWAEFVDRTTPPVILSVLSGIALLDLLAGHPAAGLATALTIIAVGVVHDGLLRVPHLSYSEGRDTHAALLAGTLLILGAHAVLAILQIKRAPIYSFATHTKRTT